MGGDFTNVYDDQTRAQAYATLDLPGTYYLAFRDLPRIISEHVRGSKALDFGCGAGRSSRFLRSLGFDVVGVDVSEPMLAQARARDIDGDYRLVPTGDLSSISGGFDLILSAFTFDNIPTIEGKIAHFRELRRLLCTGGKIVNVVSAPEIYVNEWTSFSTKDFPENLSARCGDRVRIVMLDVDDRRPVEDVLWTDAGYREVYERAGVRTVKAYNPLGDPGDGYPWVSETSVAPWAIYVLERAD